MLAIWSLVLPFLNTDWIFEISQFIYPWNLTWRILSITFRACEIQVCGSLSIVWHCLFWDWNENGTFSGMTPKDEHPRLVGAQYATEEKWGNNSRNKEEMEPKGKQHPIMDVTGDGSKIWCCKEQLCIGTWNARSMNKDKLKVAKQEMARVNIDILAISELK